MPLQCEVPLSKTVPSPACTAQSEACLRSRCLLGLCQVSALCPFFSVMQLAPISYIKFSLFPVSLALHMPISLGKESQGLGLQKQLSVSAATFRAAQGHLLPWALLKPQSSFTWLGPACPPACPTPTHSPSWHAAGPSPCTRWQSRLSQLHQQPCTSPGMGQAAGSALLCFGSSDAARLAALLCRC